MNRTTNRLLFILSGIAACFRLAAQDHVELRIRTAYPPGQGPEFHIHIESEQVSDSCRVGELRIQGGESLWATLSAPQKCRPYMIKAEAHAPDCIDVGDVLAIIRQYNRIDTLVAPILRYAADVNADGVVNYKDVRELLERLRQDTPEPPIYFCVPEDQILLAENNIEALGNLHTQIERGQRAATVCIGIRGDAYTEQEVGVQSGRLRLELPASWRARERFSVPCVLQTAATPAAWQLRIAYDTTALRLISPGLGSVYSMRPEDFVSSAGLVRLVKAVNTELTLPDDYSMGRNAFFLHFDALSDSQEGMQPPIRFEEAQIWDEQAYKMALHSETIHRLESEQSAWAPIIRYDPDTRSLSFSLPDLPGARRFFFNVTDAFGAILRQYDLSGKAFPVEIDVPEASTWPSGAYRWTVGSDKGLFSGTFIL